MPEKNRARQEAFTKRRQVEGLKRFQFWATPEEKDFLKKRFSTLFEIIVNLQLQFIVKPLIKSKIHSKMNY